MCIYVFMCIYSFFFIYLFQLRLYAVDGSSLAGFASRTAVTTLLINVNRNVFPPVFTNQNNIQVSISESAFVGSFIYDLNATDSDITVMSMFYHIPKFHYPSLVLVQPRKTRPCLTERLLMGRKESNQTNKQNQSFIGHTF